MARLLLGDQVVIEQDANPYHGKRAVVVAAHVQGPWADAPYQAVRVKTPDGETVEGPARFFKLAN
jgi:hypothetical protein